MSSNQHMHAAVRSLFAAMFVLLVSCHRDELQPLQRFAVFKADAASAEVNFCTIPPETTKGRLKFIIVYDKSGSNFGSSTGGLYATDPCGDYRYEPLKSFVAAADEDPTVYFGLVNFSDGSRRVLDASTPGHLNGFTNNPQAFTTALDGEHHANTTSSTCPNGYPNDGGWTNYLSALTTVSELIRGDADWARRQSEIIASHYVVIFVSDGVPEVDGVKQPEDDILGRVAALRALPQDEKPYVGSVVVNTVFYYNGEDPDTTKNNEAGELLRKMAARGGGDFHQFGGAIDYSRFRIPPRNVKHRLQDVFVTNMNSTWESGALLLDSDMDGIGDSLEEILGSNPHKADSDSNGVPDGVEYVTNIYSCADAPHLKYCLGDPAKFFRHPCGDNRIAPFCEPAPASGTFTYNFCSSAEKTSDKDKDGLSDCVEKESVLGSHASLWDSNGDWVPDGFALRRGLGVVNGATDSRLDSDNDGLSGYQEAKLHTPPLTPNKNVLGLKPYKYQLDLISEDERQSCYRLTVKDIAVLGEQNLLRVYITEGTGIVDDQRFMRQADKTVAPGEKVKFYDSDF